MFYVKNRVVYYGNRLIVLEKRKAAMKAEIIASGTELLLGQINDTNTSFIANQLAILGIDLYYSSIVGDNYERFLGVLNQAFQRSDIIIITGGLGPTKGDITREVIAGLMEEKMEIDPASKKHITEYFGRMGMEMPVNNLKQATLIPSATSIPNPLGTAPGWWVEKNGKTIISLPGPPAEMQPMWQREIHPRLEKKAGAIIISRVLKTWGLSEAKLDEMVGPYMGLPNPTLALYAKPDGIQMRITAKAADKETANSIIQDRENTLRSMLKDNIWGADNDALEEMIAQLLVSKGLTVAVAESFTAGFLSYSLANLPQSHIYFKGGIITANDSVRASLGINAKSTVEKSDTETAFLMAAMARDKFAADIGIGLDGFIEHKDGSILGKAYVAINLKGNSNFNVSQTYPGRHALLARRSVMHALFNLRNTLVSL
jgi:nicotinamide-nucleotide amidase